MTAAIAYRSPLGRVRCYDECGRVTLSLEPGTEADVTWESLAPEIRQEKSAYWIDKVVEAEQRLAALPTKEYYHDRENRED